MTAFTQEGQDSDFSCPSYGEDARVRPSVPLIEMDAVAAPLTCKVDGQIERGEIKGIGTLSMVKAPDYTTTST